MSHRHGALGGEHHDATAVFYGRLVEDPEVLRTITHEIYGTFTGEDAGIPADHVWQFVEQDPEVNTAPALDAW